MRGGKRPGAGRKPGSVSAAKTRLQETAKDVAAQVLSEVDAVGDLETASPAAGEAASDRLRDAVFNGSSFRKTRTDDPGQSGTAGHDSIAVVRHAGMAASGHGESASESHHDAEVPCRRGPATQRRTTASPGLKAAVLKGDVRSNLPTL